MRVAPVVVALCALTLLCGCSRKDDDENEREHRKRRINAGASGSGGAGVSLSCPFGLCTGGGGSGPEHLCRRMSELVSTDAGPIHAPAPSEKDLAQCVEGMEKMKKDQPKQYDVMEKCVDLATDMGSLVQCMTKMYLDGGVP